MYACICVTPYFPVALARYSRRAIALWTKDSSSLRGQDSKKNQISLCNGKFMFNIIDELYAYVNMFTFLIASINVE